jgi:hypothetical protein
MSGAVGRWLIELRRQSPAAYRALLGSVAAHSALSALTAPFYRSAGLSFAWSTMLPQVVALMALLSLFVYFIQVPGSGRERRFPDALLVAFLLVLFTNLASPAQYLALTLRRPLVDSQLARVDALLGVHVPALAAWTAQHRAIDIVLKVSYSSLLPQFVLPIIVLGLWAADRDRLWEYCFHFHFCLLITIACLAVWPAACAFVHYGFQSTIDQSRFIDHFFALRQGTYHIIRFDDLEGLISMPSFHTAGALMVTWAFRSYRRLRWPLAGLNVALILATFMTGAHYFVDVIATGLLFGLSVLVYRRVIEPASRRCENVSTSLTTGQWVPVLD